MPGSNSRPNVSEGYEVPTELPGSTGFSRLHLLLLQQQYNSSGNRSISDASMYGNIIMLMQDVGIKCKYLHTRYILVPCRPETNNNDEEYEFLFHF